VEGKGHQHYDVISPLFHRTKSRQLCHFWNSTSFIVRKMPWSLRPAMIPTYQKTLWLSLMHLGQSKNSVDFFKVSTVSILKPPPWLFTPEQCYWNEIQNLKASLSNDCRSLSELWEERGLKFFETSLNVYVTQFSGYLHEVAILSLFSC
jgi:hypothetical protein